MSTNTLNDHKENLLKIENTSKNKIKFLPLELLVNIFKDANNLFFNNLLKCHSTCFWQVEIGDVVNKKTLKTTKQLNYCFKQAKHLQTSSRVVYLFVGEMFKKTKINFLNNLKMSSDTNTIIDKANKILEKQSFKTNAESDPEINTLIEYYAYANENYQRSKERLDKDEEILIKAAARILKKDSSFVNQSGLKRPLIDTDELQHEVSQKKSKQEEMMKKSCCGVSLTTGCKCSFTSGIDVALCSSERGQTSGTSQVDDGTDCSTTNV